jgi:hypothetical protein
LKGAHVVHRQNKIRFCCYLPSIVIIQMNANKSI